LLYCDTDNFKKLGRIGIAPHLNLNSCISMPYMRGLDAEFDEAVVERSAMIMVGDMWEIEPEIGAGAV
jgi:hypothetical protein